MMARVLLMAALALAAGCTSTRTPIDIGDHGVFVPSARISIVPRAQTPSEPQAGHAFELGFAQANGKSTQSLSAGQVAAIGDESFSGPRQLANEVKAKMFDATWRRRFFESSQRLGLELLLGLGYADMSFAVDSGGRRGAAGYSSGGLLLGIGGIWRIRPGTSAQARLSAFTSGGFFEDTQVNRVDLALVQTLGRTAAMRAGWSFWAIDSKRAGLSEVSARLSGPALGVEISF